MPYSVLLLTIVLITVLLSLSTAQRHEFTQSLLSLGLDTHLHFNAAAGARLKVTPHWSARCEQGNHCVMAMPWWFSNDRKELDSSVPPILNEGVDLLSPTEESTGDTTTGCDGYSILCGHSCPNLQYSTPQGQLVQFDTVSCGNGGYTSSVSAPDLVYPVHVTSNDTCTSLNYINDFSRAGGFQFDITFDLHHMRHYDAQQFLLLEGKLVSLESTNQTLSTDETFLWTVDKDSNKLYASLYIMSSKEFYTSPRLLYRSLRPLESIGSSPNLLIQLFVRHVTEAPSSTCFYLDGVRTTCLPNTDAAIRSVAFISLNSRNNFGLSIMTGKIEEVLLYELGQADTVISESEIQKLYTGKESSTEEATDDCKCQHIEQPIMKRGEWQEFGHYISMHNNYCYKDLSQTSTKSMRVNENSHGLYQAFDSNYTTAWMSASALNNVNISITFPHRVKMKGITIALSTLPQSLIVWDSESSSVIGHIRVICDRSEGLCITWDNITSGVNSSERKTLSPAPALTWLFKESTDLAMLTFQLIGHQDTNTNFFLVNELSVIATCSCSPNSRCVVDDDADPSTTALNHRCVCPPRLTGVHCDRCEDGFYTTSPSGVVDNPGLCSTCGCDSKGTCQMVGDVCEHNDVDTCNSLSQCLCRYGNSTRSDSSNPGCEAELQSITPDFGPVSGGTVVTVSGKYILGYDRLYLIDTAEPSIALERTTSPALIREMEFEHLLFVSPPSHNGSLRFTVQLVNGYLGKTNLIYSYRPDPAVKLVKPRNINTKGGLRVKVSGDNLDSASKPMLLTHLHCLSSGKFYSTVTSRCEGNRTSLTCFSPDLTDELIGIKCVVSRRLRRATIPPHKDYSGIFAVLGLQFDGFSEYRRLNMSKKIRIFNNPHISNFSAEEMYIEETATHLRIQGSDLTQCCISTDYVIHVGGAECHIERVNDSTIVCRLPSTFIQAKYGDALLVSVKMGRNETLFTGSILKGGSNIWDDKEFVLTVAISSTCTFVLAMIISTAVCCVYRRHFFHVKATTNILAGSAHTIPHPPMLEHPLGIGVAQSGGEIDGTYHLQSTQYMQGAVIDMDIEPRHHLQQPPMMLSDQPVLHYIQGSPAYGDVQYLGVDEDIQYVGADEDIQYVGTDEDVQYLGVDEDIQYVGTDEDIQYVGTSADMHYVGTVEDVPYMGTVGDVQYMGTVGDVQYMGTVGDVQYMGTVGDVPYEMANKHSLYEELVDKVECMSEAENIHRNQTYFNSYNSTG